MFRRRHQKRPCKRYATSRCFEHGHLQNRTHKRLSLQEHFEIEKNQETGCVILVEEEPFAGSGRMSFQNFNPEVEKINEEHKVRIHELAVEAADKSDVSEAEMANVLGKRKQAIEGNPAAGIMPKEEPGNTSKQPPGQHSSKHSEAVNVTIHIPKKAKAGNSKPSFRRASEAMSKQKGRVS